jgi:hypothetical protein
MPTQKQLREEQALERTVLKAESIARVIRMQDRKQQNQDANDLLDDGLDPYACSPANADTFSVICPDCGQLVPSEYDSFLSQQDANDYARQHCDCHKNNKTRRKQTMISGTDKNIAALHKRMDKVLTDIIYRGGKAGIADVDGQPWLTNGIAAVIYDENSLIFAADKMEEIQGIKSFAVPGQRLAFLPNAHLEYLKPSGTCLAAQLKDDSGRRLMINNTYYHLFGDKFDYKLYIPGDRDELQDPAVYVFYLDELVGLILPIKQKAEE